MVKYDVMLWNDEANAKILTLTVGSPVRINEKLLKEFLLKALDGTGYEGIAEEFPIVINEVQEGDN